MKIEKYYLLSCKNYSEVASAFAPKEFSLAHEIIDTILDLSNLPFEFHLIKLNTSKNGIYESNDLSSINNLWLDYMPNNLAWPLFSQKLKNIIDMKLSGLEGIEWLNAKINTRFEKIDYFIPKFNRKLDVLDLNETKFLEKSNHIIEPYFSFLKIKNFSVFHNPSFSWQITTEIFVNNHIKKMILNEQLTGIKFEKANIIY